MTASKRLNSALIHTAAAVALIAASAAASAADGGWYGSVQLGHQSNNGAAINEGTNSPGTPSYDLQSGAVAGIAVGRAIGNGLRLEAELRYRDIDIDGSYRAGPTGGRTNEQFSVRGNLRSTTLMVNALYDLPVAGDFKPYLKAGIGAARNVGNADINITPTFANFGLGADFRSVYPQGSNTSLAYAVGAGVGYAITPRVTLDLGYQYINLGRAKTGVDRNGDVLSFDKPAAHEVTLGVRYNF